MICNHRRACSQCKHYHFLKMTTIGSYGSSSSIPCITCSRSPKISDNFEQDYNLEKNEILEEDAVLDDPEFQKTVWERYNKLVKEGKIKPE